MPLISVTEPSGDDFDGTGNGEFDFGTKSDNDTVRTRIMSVALQNDGTSTVITSLRVVVAADLAGAQAGEGLELLSGESVVGMIAVGCDIIVPAGWALFAFTTGTNLTVKNLIFDYQNIDLALAG